MSALITGEVSTLETSRHIWSRNRACCEDCDPLGLTEQLLRVYLCVRGGRKGDGEGETLGGTVLMFLPPTLDVLTKLGAIYRHVL